MYKLITLIMALTLTGCWIHNPTWPIKHHIPHQTSPAPVDMDVIVNASIEI